MLRSFSSHSLVVLALLAPVLACGDGASENVADEEDMCIEREQLWREVLAEEASGDGGAGPASVATSTAATSTASGLGGANPEVEIPEGCPDAGRVTPTLMARREMDEYSDNTLDVSAPKSDGRDCCYHVTEYYGVTGRPVRIDDAIVVAQLLRAGSNGDRARVPRAVVAHWEEVARLEHASVASFALLSLDLIAQGAPMDLVADSQRASLDEVRHAEAMFAHASRLGGSRVEAGEMATLASSRLSPDVDALVAATVRDGCVNETFASFEAAEQAARCDDADLARDLAAIAVDEACHAALGWRIVAWAIRAGKTTPEHVAACLRASIAELRAGNRERGDGNPSASLERHGVLSVRTRSELVAEVARRLEMIGARVLASCEVARAA